jgi:hypothetical protein
LEAYFARVAPRQVRLREGRSDAQTGHGRQEGGGGLERRGAGRGVSLTSRREGFRIGFSKPTETNQPFPTLECGPARRDRSIGEAGAAARRRARRRAAAAVAMIGAFGGAEGFGWVRWRPFHAAGRGLVLHCFPCLPSPPLSFFLVLSYHPGIVSLRPLLQERDTLVLGRDEKYYCIFVSKYSTTSSL